MADVKLHAADKLDRFVRTPVWVDVATPSYLFVYLTMISIAETLVLREDGVSGNSQQNANNGRENKKLHYERLPVFLVQ